MSFLECVARNFSRMSVIRKSDVFYRNALPDALFTTLFRSLVRSENFQIAVIGVETTVSASGDFPDHAKNSKSVANLEFAGPEFQVPIFRGSAV